MSTDSYLSDAAQSIGKPTNEGSPGEALAGIPGTKDNDCKPYYNGETHKFTERWRRDDAVPSAGWREVYVAMEVRPR